MRSLLSRKIVLFFCISKAIKIFIVMQGMNGLFRINYFNGTSIRNLFTVPYLWSFTLSNPLYNIFACAYIIEKSFNDRIKKQCKYQCFTFTQFNYYWKIIKELFASKFNLSQVRRVQYGIDMKIMHQLCSYNNKFIVVK